MIKPKKDLMEAKLLRAAVTVQLLKAPYTAAAMAEAIGHADVLAVRMCLCRLVKSGKARSVRTHGKDCKVIATYHHSDNASARAPQGVDKPHRPVLKEYPANQVRDPFHLPQNFFSRTTA